MGFKLVVGLVGTLAVGMVVSTINETAGGVVFLVGLVLTGIWVAST